MMKGMYMGAEVTVKTLFKTKFGWVREIPTSLEQWKHVCEQIEVVRQYRIPSNIQIQPIGYTGAKLAKETPVFTGELEKIEIVVTYKE